MYFFRIIFIFGFATCFPGPNQDDECCTLKEVGGVEYELAGKIENPGDYECLNGCIYTMVGGNPNNKFCFKHGNLTVECESKKEGIFIAGSYSSSEDGYGALYITSSNSFCEIPAVQPERFYPIRFNSAVCLGIYDYPKGCSVYDIDTGIWNEYWGCLSTKHNGGVAWVTDIGVFIMGGEYPAGVTLLLSDGTCQELNDFGLQPPFQTACAVPDDKTETVIIIPFNNEVISRYNKDGFVESISPPSPMQTPASCSSYRKDDGQMVLLVTNGEATATLVVGENYWTEYDGIAPKGYTSNLVNTDNTVYSALGGGTTEIERWDSDLKQWVPVYNAGYTVYDKHGMLATTVNLDSENCPIY